MMKVELFTVTVIFGLMGRWFFKKQVAKKRRQFIDDYIFPATVGEKVAERYDHLSEKDLAAVIQGLRLYFHVCHDAGKKMVSMPSQVVDVAWHELILFTKEYQSFCKNALGRFLHHTPAEAMKSATIAQTGIKVAWRYSCLREGIEPFEPNKLPSLFALDAALKIPDGFKYTLNCKSKNGQNYCASHIACNAGCGGGCAGCGSGCGGD